MLWYWRNALVQPQKRHHPQEIRKTPNNPAPLLVQTMRKPSWRRMRELCRSGGGTAVASTVAVLEHFSTAASTVLDGDGTTRKRGSPVAAENSACLENARQYKRRNGRVATPQHSCCDEKFESAVKDFNLVAEDVENSLRRRRRAETTLSSGSENGRYVLEWVVETCQCCCFEGAMYHVGYYCGAWC